MDAINLRLKENETGVKGHGWEDEDSGKQIYEMKPDRKQVNDLWNGLDQIDGAIKVLQDRTSLTLQQHKNQLWKKIDAYFTGYRNELMADSLKKKETDEDPAMREQTLNEQLELMTHMA